MNLLEYLKTTVKTMDAGPKKIQVNRPLLVCVDGTTLSVQASCGHYCHPRLDGVRNYFSVEVACLSAKPSMDWNKFAEREDLFLRDWKQELFCHIPVRLVEAYINEHGGIYV